MLNKLRKNRKKGFSLVELIVVIAVMAVLIAVLAPSLLGYVEKSRAQKDDSAMSEVTNAIKLAMADQDVYDELLKYNEINNKSGFADEVTDETFWDPTGTMRGVTITFIPEQGIVKLADGKINTLMKDPASTKQGILSELSGPAGAKQGILYNKVRIEVGDEVELTSQTYGNSPYSVFIAMGTLGGNDPTKMNAIQTYGSWGGTNLPEGAVGGNGDDGDNLTDVVGPEITTDQQLSEDSSKPAIADSVVFELSGTATDDSGVKSLTVNGDYITVNDDGTWSTTLNLITNTTAEIIIIATDNNDNSTTKTGYVVCNEVIENIEYTEISLSSSYFDEIGYDTSVTDLEIPATFQDADGKWYKIVGIGLACFNEHTNLINVTVPDGLTSIGYGAFRRCTNLASISLPDSLTSIEGYAFEGCANLALTSLPSKVTSIGTNAFYSCKSLALTSLPAELTSIGNQAFQYCTNLALTSLPAELTSIGKQAFYDCTNLALTSLPSGLTSIGDDAFSGCTKLVLTELPSGLTSIGDNAFQNCTSLALTELPSGLTSIGNAAFYGCTSLTLTELPSGVTSIGDSAFSGCTKLALTELPSGLTSIGSYAFKNCSSLTSITIPDSVTNIGECAFYNCQSLTNITFKGDKATWNAIKKWNNWNDCVPATEVKCSDGDVSL